jgi:uncharacterized membrane protein
MSSGALFLAVFLACAVEGVEALVIVLAAGTGRGWHSAISGVVAGVVVLSAVIAVLGPALAVIPLAALRLFVGGLLLIFGLRWLCKAILRAAGLKARHDEVAIFATEVAAAEAAAVIRRPVVGDWYAFTLSFKGVVLEGLEVALVVVTLGANQRSIPLASLAAITAVLVVTIAGVLVQAPLTRVPENTMKFIVGIMLTSFGVYWGAEGAGAQWPGEDSALLVVVPGVALVALALTALLRRTEARPVAAAPVPTENKGRIMARRLAAFGTFWYEFIVGDDWLVAVGVVCALALTCVLHVTTTVPVWWVLPGAVLILLPTSLWHHSRIPRTKTTKRADVASVGGIGSPRRAIRLHLQT